MSEIVTGMLMFDTPAKVLEDPSRPRDLFSRFTFQGIPARRIVNLGNMRHYLYRETSPEPVQCDHEHGGIQSIAEQVGRIGHRCGDPIVNLYMGMRLKTKLSLGLIFLRELLLHCFMKCFILCATLLRILIIVIK